MIDNIILLITGTLHHRPISELIPKCHPLGSFEQMEAIHVAATPAELYNAVLVDTPLGMYIHLMGLSNKLFGSVYHKYLYGTIPGFIEL
jgi:vacuolar-type H+-ATPase subunit C/Vma6